ncbi:metallophosphoesterase [Marinospirillum alkaliphilum]|uniref:Calcineurin-like phosphoesterase n=1 Tax=Marinospirillum alkaliphilum DSM 21637 TaxID=1122209 RepID=A0A1K1WK25_9GAMM|nr:metallophosphoesterase [Marinospirillum alkaliphilum]SFX37762.1 Calcineurin-like phosphoesterase [Marinospirillum alkaliphilum DSM 21637]
MTPFKHLLATAEAWPLPQACQLLPDASRWPHQPVIFISDLHATPEALTTSLLATGFFGLDAEGELQPLLPVSDFRLVLGGDYFDKGQQPLKLVQQLLRLQQQVQLTLLAGNHDVRTYLAMQAVGRSSDPLTGHFFLRQGSRFFSWADALRRDLDEAAQPDEATCCQRLLPPDDWVVRFSEAVAGRLPVLQVEAEIRRFARRRDAFLAERKKRRMSWRQVHAVAECWRSRFLHPEGEAFAFTAALQLLHRDAGVLFSHAGVDDSQAQALLQQGVAAMDQQFQVQLLSGQDEMAFAVYFSAAASLLRTKYRSHEWAFTQQGATALSQSGIQLLVNGHRNLTAGQQLVCREGLLCIDADISLNPTTRRENGLKGEGAGFTLLLPDAQVLAVAADYPRPRLLRVG